MTMSSDPLQHLRAGDPAADLRPTPESAARIDAAFARASSGPGSRHRQVEDTRNDLVGRRTALPRLLGIRTAATPRLRRPVAVIGATAIVVAAAVGPLRSATYPAHSAASASSVLRDAAATARHEPGTGRWRYLRVVEYVTHVRPTADGRTARAVVPRVVETWVGSSGDERRRISAAGPIRYPTAADRETFARSGPSVSVPGAGAVVAIDGRPDRRPLGDPALLPADPARLAARLRAASRLRGASLPARVALLLRDAATPPAVRAAAFELLRGLPDVQLRRDVDGPAGRTGDAVVVRDDGARTVFLFDRDNELTAIRAQGDPQRDPGIDDWQVLDARSRRDDAPRPTLREISADGATTSGPATPAPRLVPLSPR